MKMKRERERSHTGKPLKSANIHTQSREYDKEERVTKAKVKRYKKETSDSPGVINQQLVINSLSIDY
jgi:hypothetical protein